MIRKEVIAMKILWSPRSATCCSEAPVLCPACGFISHKLGSKDGHTWTYICERCHTIFVP